MANKKVKIEIEIDENVVQSLKESLERIVKLNQLPENTTIEQFIIMILKNYIQSSKAMENMSADFLTDLKNKLENIFDPSEIGTEDFYKKMMSNFKDFFNPDLTKKPTEEPKNKEPNSETVTKDPANDKKKS